MTNALTQPATRKPLRLMPAIVIGILQVLVMVVATTGVPQAAKMSVAGYSACVLCQEAVRARTGKT